MCGNGAKTVGTQTMKMPQWTELYGMIIILQLLIGYYAAALGAMIRGIVVLRIGAATLTAAATTVFESFPPRIPSPLLT